MTLSGDHGRLQAGDAQGAFYLLDDMQKRDLCPDVITFGALMHACASNGRLPEAMQAFRAMQAAGVRPNAEIFTSLIDAHVKAGTKEAIQQAFQVSLLIQGSKSHMITCCMPP